MSCSCTSSCLQTPPQGNLHMLAEHSFVNFNGADNPKLVRPAALG